MGLLTFTIVISTTRHLADGREVVYFDSVPTPREAVDPRELPPVATASQVRWDPLLGEWVVIAAHRQTRTFLPPADQCPLCPSTPERATELPEADYEVAVFENRFPRCPRGRPRRAPHAEGNPLVTLRPGEGRCEVIVFTSDHDRSFADLGPSAPGWSSTRGRTARRRCRRCRGWSRCSCSRTTARRSG